jgi:hypothetical protein
MVTEPISEFFAMRFLAHTSTASANECTGQAGDPIRTLDPRHYIFYLLIRAKGNIRGVIWAQHFQCIQKPQNDHLA